MRRFIVRHPRWTLCTLLLVQSVYADDTRTTGICTSETAVGEVVSVQGSVDVLDAQGTQLRRLTPGAINKPQANRRLCAGETLRTGPLARATLAVREPPSVIRLDANSLLATGDVEQASDFTSPPLSDVGNNANGVLGLCRSTLGRVLLDLKRGALRLFTTQPARLDIRTPYLNASVEGTEFSLLVTERTAQVSVVDGVVGACNVYGGTAVRSGQTASAGAGQPPAIVDSGNTVRWALHYPTLDKTLQGTPGTQEALALMNSGRVFDALALLGDDSAVDLALRAIIAITTNEHDAAQELAQRSVDLDDSSPIAWTALSYVQQASYELEQALVSAAIAVRLAPQNAVGLARLAELEFIAGDKSSAEAMAKRAVREAPDLSRTYSVLGFIHLDGYDMEIAETAFQQAIERDETDPLPRLGLALVETRRGRIPDALSKLEAAVSLDPESALLRVYLGRLYALDDRTEQALDQFRLAGQIDESDPLPHLYRAFVHHSANNMHMALNDLQLALEKNGNRGVYRTRSLLDADLAITLAARGRIYEELGFTNLTLSEATDAIHRNPRDHAAHRLMADAYRYRPRHEIARASEQLQAQIRQPLNSNPIPSSLGLSRLDEFPDTGPRSVSLNEYGRLFSQQGFTSSVSQAFGPYSTQANEVQANWLLPTTLMSASFYQLQSDGLDFNRDGRFDLASLYLQQWFGKELSAQIELSDSYSEGGADRQIRFDRDSYNVVDRFEDERKRSRLGLRWSFSEKAELYVNHDYSTLARRLDASASIGDLLRVTDSHHSEVQLAIKKRHVDQILGVGYSTQQSDDTCYQSIFSQDGDQESESAVDHAVAYGYAYPDYQSTKAGRIDYTLGIGFDDLTLNSVEYQTISPKLGINIEQSKYRLRSVLARTVTRTLATNRTIEPTQIAGFSQFYDDFAGTVSTLAGLGAGFKLEANERESFGKVYIDTEFVHRYLEKPTASGNSCIPGPPDSITEFEERRYSISLYSSDPRLSIALRLEHEKYISPDGAPSSNNFVDSTTNRIKLELGTTINSHTKLRLIPQYVRQSGTFFDAFAERVYFGHDSFWSVDTALELELGALLGKRVSGSATIELKNLFDSDFRFQESDPGVPSLSYGRELGVRLNLGLD